MLQVLDLRTRALRTAALTGLSPIAPSDPEPEYVDINDRNEAVVSLQENNHLAIVDLARARVTRREPDVESADDASGKPIPWTALSGLAGDPRDRRTMWAVSDSALAQAYICRVDVSCAGSSRPNLLVRTDANGTVRQSVPLPPSLVATATSSGFEGVAVTAGSASPS